MLLEIVYAIVGSWGRAAIEWMVANPVIVGGALLVLDVPTFNGVPFLSGVGMDELKARGGSMHIADGVHVHPAAMAILLRVKGLERVALMSDAAPLAGLPDGEYEWEHKSVFVQDGSCRLADGTIAGAHALLDTGVRNLVNLVGLPLEQALAPATRVPAGVLGLRKGRLAPGCDADVVLLDEALQPALTIVGGKEMFRPLA